MQRSTNRDSEPAARSNDLRVSMSDVSASPMHDSLERTDVAAVIDNEWTTLDAGKSVAERKHNSNARATAQHPSTQSKSTSHRPALTCSENQSRRSRSHSDRTVSCVFIDPLSYNRAHVEEIQSSPAGECRVRMRSGKTYNVGHRYTTHLRSLAEAWIDMES